jgi:formamidopyrimidine-DNA glycosylase
MLHQQLRGRQLIGFIIAGGSRYQREPLLGVNLLRTAQVVEAVTAIGKKIVFSLTTMATSPQRLLIVSSLGMEGRWLYQPQQHTSLILEFGVWEQVGVTHIRNVKNRIYYDDSRRFGRVTITADAATYHTTMKDVGPDWLTQPPSFDQWQQTITGRVKKSPLHRFLVEQKNYSGIGNYLRAEILYHSGLSPHRTLSSLTTEESGRLWQCCQQVITASYRQGGHTSRTYLSPDGQPGGYPVVIYQQEACPRGHSLRREKVGSDRTMWWCEQCQR